MVKVDEIKGIEAYEKTREEFRRRIIGERNRRRVTLGDRVSLAFENHETVLFQIQEMVRAERITEPRAIVFEVDTYNTLLGDSTTLAATLFIEVSERDRIKEEIDKFQGLDRERRLYMQIADDPPISAQFESGHSTEDRISAVHYVRFPLGEEGKKAFMDLSRPVRIVVDHPNYRARTELSESTRLALVEDLQSA